MALTTKISAIKEQFQLQFQQPITISSPSLSIFYSWNFTQSGIEITKAEINKPTYNLTGSFSSNPRNGKQDHLVCLECVRMCVLVLRREHNFVVIYRSLPQETGRLPQRNDWQLNVFVEGLGSRHKALVHTTAKKSHNKFGQKLYQVWKYPHCGKINKWYN